MKALVYDGVLKLARVAAPRLVPGEAIIQMRMAGICNTDLEITRGYMGYSGILGHEFVGTVEHSHDRHLQGKRVVGEINAACGVCTYCLAGMPTHCANRTTLGIMGRDGAFAEYLSLPERNLHVVPDSISDEQAVFVEPLAAAVEILQQVHIRPTDSVIVLGDGKLGLLVAQVVSLVGCTLRVVGKHEEKLAKLASRGIPTCHVDQMVDSLRADIVIDCTGNASGFALARSLVRPRGILVLKSTFHGASDAPLTPVVIDEITVVGLGVGPSTLPSAFWSASWSM
jgi:alcohol dehydrogenase